MAWQAWINSLDVQLPVRQVLRNNGAGCWSLGGTVVRVDGLEFPDGTTAACTLVREGKDPLTPPKREGGVGLPANEATGPGSSWQLAGRVCSRYLLC